jgi:hypothetical protein
MEFIAAIAPIVEASVIEEAIATEAIKPALTESVYSDLEMTIERPIEVESTVVESVSLEAHEVLIEEDIKFKPLEEVLKDASGKELEIYENAELVVTEVNGRETLMRTDIDYGAKDQFGRTNLERMEQGLSPLVDGQPVELHHIGQEMDSPLAELTPTEHRGEGNYSTLHDVTKESEINRTLFNAEKEAYWKARAEQIKAAGGI